MAEIRAGVGIRGKLASVLLGKDVLFSKLFLKKKKKKLSRLGCVW